MRLYVRKMVVMALVSIGVTSANAQMSEGRTFNMAHLDTPLSDTTLVHTTKKHPATVGKAGGVAGEPLRHGEYTINEQILCLKKPRTGTRIVTRRCQSVADWKTEIAGEYVRRYLLEM